MPCWLLPCVSSYDASPLCVAEHKVKHARSISYTVQLNSMESMVYSCTDNDRAKREHQTSEQRSIQHGSWCSAVLCIWDYMGYALPPFGLGIGFCAPKLSGVWRGVLTLVCALI